METTIKELNQKILNITMYIRKHYPELSKYLDEMPVSIPDENDPHITIKNLKEYIDSLNTICKKYGVEHPH